jgi:hypothetical protein
MGRHISRNYFVRTVCVYSNYNVIVCFLFVYAHNSRHTMSTERKWALCILGTRVNHFNLINGGRLLKAFISLQLQSTFSRKWGTFVLRGWDRTAMVIMLLNLWDVFRLFQERCPFCCMHNTNKGSILINFQWRLRVSLVQSTEKLRHGMNM